MQITHCPQCETAFKVSPQQRELANGWVRCGRCAHVFEAHLYFEKTPEISEKILAPQHNPQAPELFRAAVTSPAAVDKVVQASPPKAAPLAWHVDVWQIAAFFLVLIFLGQMLLVQRNWLGAEEPALRPVLSALCRCDITWPMEPDAVLIESSSFTENPEGGYTVQLRLKNTQHHAVATPALELNLTDIQDQVLVRRVFRANELSAKDHMPALRDLRSTIHFDLDDPVSKRVTGFRAIIFYP
ncbi:MAG: hypothetical protein RL175_1262 [Pseudomonadota bacterium]|jgi:predicted Zn finger-like uncharacterized protein